MAILSDYKVPISLFAFGSPIVINDYGKLWIPRSDVAFKLILSILLIKTKQINIGERTMTKRAKKKAYCWANLCKKVKSSGGVVKKYQKGQLKGEKLELDKRIAMGPLPLAPSGLMSSLQAF